MSSRLRELVEQATHDCRLPAIAGERCVHALIETASCRDCVDTCPRGAWLLDDDALGLDSDACDGCGLCVPACLQGAITQAQPLRLPVRKMNGLAIALLGCEKAGIESKETLLPCVHSVGLQDLLGLLRQGIHQLAAVTAECDECGRGKVVRLRARVYALNKALMQTNEPGFRFIEGATGLWNQLVAQGETAMGGQQLSRRGFLGKFASTGLQEFVNLINVSRDELAPYHPPGQLLPSSSPETCWPYLPVIDAQLCNGCDACLRLCPHQAILLGENENSTCYRVEPKSCSGCKICMDVCDQHAIVVQQWQVQDQNEVTLATTRCKACGVAFHIPAGTNREKPSYCRICSQHNHYTKLFQVLD